MKCLRYSCFPRFFVIILLLAVFFVLGSYFEATGSYTIGTVIAHGYVALTNAVVYGAVLSMTATTTLTVSAVRLPSAGFLALSGPSYTTLVNMLSASSFAVLGGDAIVNTVSAPGEGAEVPCLLKSLCSLVVFPFLIHLLLLPFA
jgi:hypothetical protein